MTLYIKRTQSDEILQTVDAEVFDGVNLKQANLRGADLSGMSIRHAELSRAAMRGADLSGSDALGRYLVFDTAGRSDTSFRIERVIDANTVSIGHKTLIDGLADPGDFSQGVVHTIAPGDTFSIPQSASWVR